MSFGMGGSQSGSKTKTDMASTVNPWAPALPYLSEFLSNLPGNNNNFGTTPNQNAAFDSLIHNAQNGDPYLKQIQAATKTDFGLAGGVNNAYNTLRSELNPYANGTYTNASTNPYIQSMINTTGNDIQNRIAQEFAGSGRSLSPSEVQAQARGISQGTMPILSNFYNQQQQNQLGAAQALNNAAGNSANLQAGLNNNAYNASNQAINAQNWGANTVLNLEQQRQNLPYQNAANYASLLLPLAGLGRQSTQQGATSTSGSNWGMQGGINMSSAPQMGSPAAGLLGMFA